MIFFPLIIRSYTPLSSYLHMYIARLLAVVIVVCCSCCCWLVRFGFAAAFFSVFCLPQKMLSEVFAVFCLSAILLTSSIVCQVATLCVCVCVCCCFYCFALVCDRKCSRNAILCTQACMPGSCCRCCLPLHCCNFILSTSQIAG